MTQDLFYLDGGQLKTSGSTEYPSGFEAKENLCTHLFSQ